METRKFDEKKITTRDLIKVETVKNCISSTVIMKIKEFNSGDEYNTSLPNVKEVWVYLAKMDDFGKSTVTVDGIKLRNSLAFKLRPFLEKYVR